MPCHPCLPRHCASTPYTQHQHRLLRTSCTHIPMALATQRPQPHCRPARARQPLRVNAISGLLSFIGQKPAAQRIKLKEEVRTDGITAMLHRHPCTARVSGQRDAAACHFRCCVQLLELLPGLGRGAGASEEQKAEVERLASALERTNPTNKPLASPLLTGAPHVMHVGLGSCYC